MFFCMPRPVQNRTIGFMPRIVRFTPPGVARIALEATALTRDELAAARLADIKERNREQAAPKMAVSRSADALVHGKSLKLEGGPVQAGSGRAGICPRDCPCRHRKGNPP